ncbi:MAG: hypothetical protein ACLPWS_02395 [Rhodomicrobium sp.]
MTSPKSVATPGSAEEKKGPKMNVLRSLKPLGQPLSAIAAIAVLSALLPCAAPAAPLKLHTDQEMIEELLQPNDLDVKNPNAVFEAVFDALPSKVTVYPTESYYYFTFPLNGIDYAGNIRFDAWDQFDGKVHFAYFVEYAYWRKPLEPVYKKMGPDDGVHVTQVNKFLYKVSLKGKTVEFALPDLSNVKPAPGMLRADEVYIGPSWDESGVQFFLVYNKTAKTFLYLLVDTPKMDQYVASSISPAATIGIRTSFVLYKDKLVDRQILIGDFIGHTMLNDYFDGPFDQLPDNYVQGNALLDAILEVEPGLKNEKTDRYGADPTGEFRYGITTYKYYGEVAELQPIIDCAAKNDDPAIYYKCFDSTKANEEEENGTAFLKAKPQEQPEENAPAAAGEKQGK